MIKAGRIAGHYSRTAAYGRTLSLLAPILVGACAHDQSDGAVLAAKPDVGRVRALAQCGLGCPDLEVTGHEREDYACSEARESDEHPLIPVLETPCREQTVHHFSLVGCDGDDMMITCRVREDQTIACSLSYHGPTYVEGRTCSE